jgi:hypothetical protein
MRTHAAAKCGKGRQRAAKIILLAGYWLCQRNGVKHRAWIVDMARI